jgi:glycosyltransferase involved in cell wall biosynthesis
MSCRPLLGRRDSAPSASGPPLAGKSAVGDRIDNDLIQAVMARSPDTNGNGNGAAGRRRQRRPKISVVVPTLNEEPNLPFVLPGIGAWVDEVILVDGRSTDRTLEVAQALLPNLKIVHQEGEGKGDGLRAGFAAATGDIIVMLDADGSTDPREIPAFVGALLTGAEFVKGTRFAQGAGTEDMTLLRKMGNRGLILIVRLLFGGRFTDLCYGYIGFWKRVLPEIDPDSDGFAIETQMCVRALRARIRITEVPSFERKRIHGKSNLRAIPDGWLILKTILHERLRSRRAPVTGTLPDGTVPERTVRELVAGRL